MPSAIRSATLDDLPAILAIERQAPSAAHWPAEEYQQLVKTGVVLVAEQPGKLCGFVSAKAVADEWEIENVVVATEVLRQGIADRLLQALIDQAEKAGASRILLEVRESNRPGRRLYEKHAFREAGRRLKYYNDPLEDAILYEHRCASEQYQ
jgi:[ribosomal protein S18]-alanine N-acetyltransferase